MSAPDAPGFPDSDDALRLREALDRAGYGGDGVAARLGVATTLAVRPADVAPWTRRTREGTSLDTLIRLFLLGRSEARTAAERALAPLSLERAEACGVLETSGDRATPLLTLLPFEGLVLAADRSRDPATRARDDFVMGIGKGSRILAHALLPPRADAAGGPSAAAPCLDLGTGCGALALLFGRGGAPVVATDRNPRALAFARFNAALAGARLDARAGDLFGPVRGERFQRVACHPPFVIAPDTRFQYRDSGVRGDVFCRRIVREVPAHLVEGGTCQLVFNCVQIRGRPWQQELAAWFEGTGCDALVWAAETQDASAYADTWIRNTESPSDERAGERYDEWMDFFEGEGIEAVTYGVIHMRRDTSRPNQVEIDDSPLEVAGSCREQVQRCLDAADWIARRSDDDLLDTGFRLAPGIGLRQVARARGDDLALEEVRLERADGLLGTTRLDPAGHWLVAHCDGRPLRATLERMLEGLGGDRSALHRSALPAVRMLVRRGYLAPAGAGHGPGASP